LAFAVWLVSRERTPLSAGRRPAPILSMLPGLVGGGMIAAIGLWPAVALSYGESPEIIERANQIYVFERLPHHLAILSQEPDRLLERLLRHLSVVVASFALVWLHGRSLKWYDAMAQGPAGRLPPQTQTQDPSPSERLTRIWRFALAALMLTMTGLVIEVALQDHSVLAASILRYYWYRLGDFAVPLAVAMFAARAGELALVRRTFVGAVTLVGLMAFPAWYLSKVTLQRLQDPAPRTERANKVLDWGDWLDATEWVREHSPRGAMFLTPRSNQSFKWRTGRPEVVTQKDIPQSARGIVQWQQRLDEVYGYTNEFGERDYVKSLGHHGTKRLLEIARTYQADFVLTDTRQFLGLPIEHLNDTYVVYRVPANADE
jgi:hypothetical protein